jgi:hypothetical protein
MIVVPREKPELAGLNSYYVRVERLIEHCGVEFEAGCLLFRAPNAEAAVYFDADAVLETCLCDSQGETYGEAALKNLLHCAARNSYGIEAYRIEPEHAHLWAAAARAERLYRDLSAEFTDLRGLVRKMEAEHLTGFVEISFPGGAASAVLLLDRGRLVTGSYALEDPIAPQDDPVEALYRLSKERGGTIQVCRLAAPTPGRREAALRRPASASVRAPVLQVAQRVLRSFETLIGSEKSVATPFSTLLRGKFLSKAEKYEFLDPFAAEFRYEAGEVSFTGDADPRTLGTALGECVRELATELNLYAALRTRLQDENWADPSELAILGLGG